ncbi:MAG TPA: hypothetical protein VKU00_16235, partial [Chthonomonadaceae bacterium]|nr:hypothetical protein [Chthonomonadaceae bacterium]
MKTLVLFLIAGLCLTLTNGVHAKPAYLKVLTDTYKPNEAALSTRSCANCHASDSDFKQLNPYGKQIQQALQSAGTKTLTPEIVHSVETQAANPGDITN